MLVLALLSMDAVPGADFAAVVATNRAKWLSDDDYPLRANGLGKSGVTEADIFVNASGKPEACTVRVSSGSHDLDSQSCAAAMHRGVFTPARDADGMAMAGIYRFSTAWQLQDDFRTRIPADVTLAVARLPEQKTRLVVRLRYIVDEQGHILRCAIEHSSGFAAADAAACAAMKDRYTFAPARDAAGKAWRVVRTQSVALDAAPPAEKRS